MRQRYGLQTRNIVAILDQMKSATPEQIKKLSAARAARNHAWDAARITRKVRKVRDALETWKIMKMSKNAEVAWNAARAEWLDGYGQNAGRGGAEFTFVLQEMRPWQEAWDDAWNAITALTCKELISEHGFTQDRYDGLIAPWETVFGKIEITK